MVREAQDSKATEAELVAFQSNPRSVRYVVCLEPGCGAKLRDIGCAHVSKIHGLTPEAYAEKYPGMPIKAQKRGRLKGMFAEDTEARITIIADRKSQGEKDYKIEQEWFAITGVHVPAMTTKTFIRKHRNAIAQEQAHLSALSESERKAAAEVAMKTLRS